MKQDIYSTKSAAEELGISEMRVRQLAQELGARKLGRDYLLTRENIDHMRARRTRRGPEPKNSKQSAVTISAGKKKGRGK